jgi:hypothetical protein
MHVSPALYREMAGRVELISETGDILNPG